MTPPPDRPPRRRTTAAPAATSRPRSPPAVVLLGAHRCCRCSSGRPPSWSSSRLPSWWPSGSCTRGFSAKDIDLPEQPLMLGGVVMVVVAYFCGAPALVTATAVTALVIMLWLLRRGVEGYVKNATASVFTLVYVPFLGVVRRAAAGRGRRHRLRPAWRRRRQGRHHLHRWSPSPPTSAATSPACCSASTRWRRSSRPKKSWEGFAGSVVLLRRRRLGPGRLPPRG